MDEQRNIPPVPSIRRFPVYLRYLLRTEENREWISTSEIAEYLDLKPIQVRKDLALTGIGGTPKKGYKRRDLIISLQNILGWDRQSAAVLVGTGALGTALLGYRGFLQQGLHIYTAFDKNPSVIGQEKYGIKIHSMEQLPEKIQQDQILIGIICVPHDGAQEVADMMIKSGIKAIWNFAPIKIRGPENIIIQNENLASSLGIITLKLSNQGKTI